MRHTSIDSGQAADVHSATMRRVLCRATGCSSASPPNWQSSQFSWCVCY